MTGEHVAPLSQLDVDRITRADHHDTRGHGGPPVQANRLQAYLQQFFSWALGCNVRGEPHGGLRKRFEGERARHLSGGGLARVCGWERSTWDTRWVRGSSSMCTGQRLAKDLATGMVMFKAGVWLLSEQETDVGTQVPLPALARKVPGRSAEFTGPYLFTAPR